MVALDTLDSPDKATFGTPTYFIRDATSSAVMDQPPEGRPPRPPHTDWKVLPEDKGSESKVDIAESVMAAAVLSAVHEVAMDNRVALAKEIASDMNRVMAARNAGALAASIQVLRRELAQAHHGLRDLPSEATFRSIITLVEGSIQTADWKNLSKAQLEEWLKAVKIGCASSPVRYEDYQRTAFAFHNMSLRTTPSFEVEVDSEDDDSEDEPAEDVPL